MAALLVPILIEGVTPKTSRVDMHSAAAESSDPLRRDAAATFADWKVRAPLVWSSRREAA